MQSNNIQKNIMRRVYYSYVLSITEHAMFWRGLFLGGAIMLLAEWLHVAKIVQNFLAVPIGTAPKYVFNAFSAALAGGEVVMVLTLIMSGIVFVSVLQQFARSIAVRRWVF